MKTTRLIPWPLLLILPLLFNGCGNGEGSGAEELQLNEKGYFEATGINYLVFDYYYSGPFGDEKNSGIQIIHHGIRTATNGDVRLEPTPEQWDAIPEFDEKKVDREEGFIEASLGYPSYGFGYRVRTEPSGDKLRISVILEEPLPDALEGKAGFNLEFLPAAYFSKTFTMDGKNGVIPLYPGGPVEKPAGVGEVRPLPLVTGKELVLAPGDPEKEIAVKSLTGDLSLYDGRNVAQNGWFVLRSLIPAGETGNVIQWEIDAHTIPGWERPPVISHSQVGYHPGQQKRAVIELDNSSKTDMKARLYKISPDEGYRVVLETTPALWGDYLRYTYVIFDFSRITGDGIYCLEYGETRTRPFLIGKDVYRDAWQPTLDIFFPVQMDHMFVNEAYRVWHGAAHLDDARQARWTIRISTCMPRVPPPTLLSNRVNISRDSTGAGGSTRGTMISGPLRRSPLCWAWCGYGKNSDWKGTRLRWTGKGAMWIFMCLTVSRISFNRSNMEPSSCLPSMKRWDMPSPGSSPPPSPSIPTWATG